jgi:hypothetical protein
MRATLATLVLAVCFAAAAPAQTSPHRHHHRHVAHHGGHGHHVASEHRHSIAVKTTKARTRTAFVRWLGPDARPAQWCGWFMRQVFHVADRSYNWAPNWAHWGHASLGPQVGAVVVWTYHVGLIAGGPDKQGRWLVRSGNDGNAVRTRYLSVAKAIAFRMP